MPPSPREVAAKLTEGVINNTIKRIRSIYTIVIEKRFTLLKIN